MSIRIRIHASLPCVRETLGPGRRAVLWTQGCRLHCPGCMVPEAWDIAGGEAVDPLELAERLLADPEIEGITVSGGEPTEQAGAVALLLERFRNAGKNTWLYTGRTIEELVALDDPAIDRLLSLVDVLVDGRYDTQRAGSFRLRGSANQRIIRLTNAIPESRIDTGEASRVEISLDGNGRLVVVGIPPPGFLEDFRKKLEKRGVLVSGNGF